MAPDIVEKKTADADADADKAGATAKKPIFEKEKVTVIFVLGGPGAGMSVSLCSTPTHSMFNSGSSFIL